MRRLDASGRQLSLFDADQHDLPFDAGSPPEPGRLGEAAEQLPLFEGKAPLVGEVELRVSEADFPAALAAYERLRRTYPEDDAVSSFEFLLSIPDDLWSASRPDGERLAVWRKVAQRYPPGSSAYVKARDAFYRRVLSVAAPRDLAVAYPWAAHDIANYLVGTDEWRAARDVVRDVLLAGQDLKPLAFVDRAVRDLLAEEDAPEWLASLGAIRRLWARWTPEIGVPGQIRARLSAELPEGERERALDFWFCLCVSGLGSRVEERLRLSAHRRMKKLHSRLHEEYMTGRSLA